jgi:nucleoside-diphosphate-sugar epimerase
MSILITGGSGFLGSALINRLLGRHPGITIYDLSRHPKPRPPFLKGVLPLAGDILKPNLGLAPETPRDLTAVYHLAALHYLGDDKEELTMATNVTGTANVIDFCERHHVEHLFFCSTAYASAVGRNPYERSKAEAEDLVKRSSAGLKYTIFKPSIVMGSEEYLYLGHFLQLVLLIIRINRTAETMRRAFEGTMRLPALRPLFRLPGDPAGRLNLISVEDVAAEMAAIEDQGTFWLTNPDPPTLEQICGWVSEVILVDVKMESEFKAMPLELLFQKYGGAFLPYLQGDNFESKSVEIDNDDAHDDAVFPGTDIESPEGPPDFPAVKITRELIQKSVRRMIMGGNSNVISL